MTIDYLGTIRPEASHHENGAKELPKFYQMPHSKH